MKNSREAIYSFLRLAVKRLGVLMINLELTEWAQQINESGYSHGNKNDQKSNFPEVLKYIIPFIKELILIGVPLMLTLLWIKLVKAIKNR